MGNPASIRRVRLELIRVQGNDTAAASSETQFLFQISKNKMSKKYKIVSNTYTAENLKPLDSALI